MNSDFPTITRITEAKRADDAECTIRLDLHTEDGQRYVRLSAKAARELLDSLDGLLHESSEGKAEAAETGYRFKM